MNLALDDRLALHGVNDDVKQCLRDFRPTLDRHIMSILDDFYGVFVAGQVFASVVEGQTDRLKRAPCEHWQRLFGATFDAAYAAKTVAIGGAHARVGIEPSWYIAGDRFILGRLQSLVTAHHGFSPRAADRTRAAIAAAVMLDMDLALGVHAARTEDTGSERRTAGFANDLMDRMVDLAVNINEASISNSTILGKLQVADDIAKQTNLLALSATIEAARAGEMGKGFAVVATEVKSLAQQTSQATDDIRQSIDGLRAEMGSIMAAMSAGTAAVERGGRIMAEVNDGIVEIDQRIDSVSARMAEVAHILTEQTEAVDEVAGSVATVAIQSKENLKSVRASITTMGGIEGLIEEQLKALTAFELPAKIVRLAKADHVIWKKRLTDMIAGITALKSDELTDHHSCRLGKWYYSDNTGSCRQHPAFARLEGPHQQVHAAGIAAVKAFNDGRIDLALMHLKEVEKASVDVLGHLDDLAEYALQEADLSC